MNKALYIFLLLFTLPFFARAQDRHSQDSLIEISGVTLTADSALSIPNVSIILQGSGRGTISNSDGVFSLVGIKGDVLVFSAIGFKTQTVKIPDTLKNNHYSFALLLAPDTTYLPVTTIKPYPTKDEFRYAFLHWQIPTDQYDIAKRNTRPEDLRALSYYVSPDGAAGVNQTFNQQFQAAQYKGGFPPMNIFNPLAWAQFIQAVKNGDFKRKD